jgi:hypothetical protein
MDSITLPQLLVSYRPLTILVLAQGIANIVMQWLQAGTTEPEEVTMAE